MILAFVAAVAAQAPTAACPNLVTPQAFVCRALQASNAGNPDAAAQAFEQAAAAQSDEAEKAKSWAAAGNMWIAANQPGKAALALDKALTGTGLQAEQRGEALLDRARAAEAQNDLPTARSKVTEAARTISDDPFLWYFSAALGIRENDAVTAKAAIGRALTLEPNNPTILFEAGHVYQFAGDLAAARDYWSRASAVDPNGKSGQAAREALKMLPAPAVTKVPDQPRS
ncbi:tetratricopeptide repeat protein [Sphingomonas daechungensis]|uniref:tetratricopeptide repeat protein n=1 Tax=Sphingomonas daechungensis TaxID=1176646 RepID=UPI003784158E